MGDNRQRWTAEEIATASRRYLEGASATVIARELGKPSRNAVLGMLFRHGVRRLDASPPTERLLDGYYSHKVVRPVKPKREPRPRKPRTNIASAFMATVGPKPPSDHTLREDTPLDLEPVSLLDLKPHCCKWPVSGEGADTLFCSVPSGDRVYCGKHAKRAYDKPKPQQRPEYRDPSERRAA